MGRPRLAIDADLVTELAKIHCTYDEIAAVVGCSTDTLKRRFADRIEKGRHEGKTSLRRAQHKKAIDEGNPAMLIWLGKQHLSQSDQTFDAGNSSRDTAEIVRDAVREILDADGLRAA